ncbi:BAG domain [Dillenia turbinata]|uniref:BAG domain n=1 Tax=Dillenia turbinata TaxID=194707 RepID=A0AAN8VBK4_9MAGN
MKALVKDTKILPGSEKVAALETAVQGDTKVEDKDLLVLTELLMAQLLKLDSVEAEGEAKVQRRSEVCRVQDLVDMLDKLKATNSNPFGNGRKEVAVTTGWASFEPEIGSFATPMPKLSSTTITEDWELFD